jgi:hypothetical protein
MHGGRPLDCTLGPSPRLPLSPQLFWPDESLWRLVYLYRVDTAAKTAQ